MAASEPFRNGPPMTRLASNTEGAPNLLHRSSQQQQPPHQQSGREYVQTAWVPPCYSPAMQDEADAVSLGLYGVPEGQFSGQSSTSGTASSSHRHTRPAPALPNSSDGASHGRSSAACGEPHRRGGASTGGYSGTRRVVSNQVAATAASEMPSASQMHRSTAMGYGGFLDIDNPVALQPRSEPRRIAQSAENAGLDTSNARPRPARLYNHASRANPSHSGDPSAQQSCRRPRPASQGSGVEHSNPVSYRALAPSVPPGSQPQSASSSSMPFNASGSHAWSPERMFTEEDAVSDPSSAECSFSAEEYQELQATHRRPVLWHAMPADSAEATMTSTTQWQVPPVHQGQRHMDHSGSRVAAVPGRQRARNRTAAQSFRFSEGAAAAEVRAALQSPSLRAAAPTTSPPHGEEFEQRVKDERLGELLQLAAMQGLGDIDLECAIGVLEDVRWDVTEAFAQLCGGNGATAAAAQAAAVAANREATAEAAAAAAAEETAAARATGLASSGARRRGVAANRIADSAGSTDNHLQEEFDRMFTEEERLPRHPRRQGHFAAAERHFAAAQSFASDNFRQRARAQELSESHQALMPESLPMRRHGRQGIEGVILARALALADRNESLLRAHENLPDELEFEGMHALLLDMLMESQDEAGLQEAMRLSSEEAYSGGFSVPPVDEAVLQKVTRTSQFSKNDVKGQCAVCLMDFDHGDPLRTLECSHGFHMACIDQWLAQSATCPVCKKPVGECEGETR